MKFLNVMFLTSKKAAQTGDVTDCLFSTIARPVLSHSVWQQEMGALVVVNLLFAFLGSRKFQRR